MIAAADNIGMILFEILIFVVIGAGVILLGIGQKRAARKRSLGLQQLASRLGFEDFNPNRDDAFATGWGFLQLLAGGDERYAFNVFRGKHGAHPLFVFDYHYKTGSGKSTREYDLTMLMLVFKEVFPQVTIQPGGENLLAGMAAAFGGEEDIQFESAEFSRAFSVRSEDKRFAYDVCNPQMIEYLLANPGLQVEIQGPVVLLAFEPQLPVGEIESNLQRLLEIRSRMPNYLFTNS